MPRRVLTILVAGLALLTLAGCSNAPADTGGSGNTAAAHEQAMQFAQCMRDHGVSAFPDPDASGNLTIDQVANGSSVDTRSATFQAALTACKSLEPAGFTGKKRSAQEQSAALKFAQCMRDNGVPDFPDPTTDSPLIDTNQIPSANRPGGMDALHAASQACRQYLAAAGVHP
jgi:hypothetical protein